MNAPAQSKQYYLPAGGIEMQDAEFEEMIDEKMQEENAEFEQFKTEMHDAQFDAKITVGKKLTDSNGRPLGKQVFECFECGLEDYTFSQLCTRIREDYGTGLYKIQGRDSKGKYKFNKVVGILAPNQTDNPPANDAGFLIDKFSDAMQRQQMQTETMLKDLMGPRTGGDAIDQITKLATAVGPLLAAMGIGHREPPPVPKTLLEQMTEYKMMMELFGGGEGGGLGGGDANLYSLLGETVKAFGLPIAQAIAAGQQSGEISPTGVLTKETAALPNPEKTKMTEQAEAEALKGQIKILIANAEGGIDALQMANMIVEKTPEESLDNLFEFLSGDDWFDKIVFLVPEALEHKNWFTIMRDQVIELLTEPDEGPIVPESDAGADDKSVAGKTDASISDESNGDVSPDS